MHGFILPEKCKKIIDARRRESVPEMEFFEENLSTGLEEDRVKCDVLRECYVRWCDVQGIKPKSQKRLGETLKKLFPLCSRKRGRDGINLTYFYYAIKWSDDSVYIVEGQ
jgi:hypothetical protein